MRTDLSPPFLTETEKNNRFPVTLCEFHFSDGIRYLSDQVIGVADGFNQDFEPLVENWGNLKDNVRIEPILGASSLEVRQMNLSIINIGDPPFSQKFKDVNPENVKVYIYQWFRGIPVDLMVLLDIFVCQDPIAVSEAQSLVRIQLVSPIMTQNPFIWGPNRFVEVRYPMVLGKWRTVARDMETGPTAFLLYDIDQNFTGEVFLDANSVKSDWPTPPFNVFIDSEQITVDTMEISKMNITARGQAGTVARPHIRGALVCDPTAQYDYSLTAGPVQSIDNILADDEAYNNPFTVFPGQDPAIIRFDGRPPWHQVEQGTPGEPIIPDPETTSQYGTASETDNEVVSAPSNPGNINNAGSNAVMSFDSTVGDNVTGGSNYATSSEWDDPPPDPSGAAVIDVINPEGAYNGNNNDQVLITHDSDISAQTILEPFTFYFGVSDWPDLSHLGTFVSVEFKCYLYNNGTKGVFNNSGNTLSFHVNGAPAGGDDEVRFWGTFGKSYDGGSDHGINSWSALRSANVGLFWNLTSLDESIGRTQFDVEIWYIEAVVTYIGNDDPTYPKQEVVSHFNRDLSSLGAFVSAEVEVRFDCSSINHTLDQDIVFRTSNNPANNSVLWGRTISSTQSMATVKVYPSIGSMATLQSARVGLRHWTDSPATPGARRYATTNIASVLWKITYQPGAIDQPDEERVVYVNELTADVTAQGGADQTPARAVQSLLENVGNMGEYIDTANFDEKHALYDAAQYYFNGLIDGETRLHDALKSPIRQGTTRLAWNAGKVKLVSTFVDSLEPVVPTLEMIEAARVGAQANEDLQYIFKPDHRQRSVTEKRMRFDDVTNKVTIRYNPDYKLQEWLGELEVKNDESINQVGEQVESLDYPYVSNADVISDIGDRILELKGRPRAFDTFRVYFKGFKIEKSDQMFFETDFNAYYGVIGPVLTANRVFGSGKAGRMNLFEITIMSTPIVAHQLTISDTIQVNDPLTLTPAFSIQKIIQETVQVQDLLTNQAILTLFLNVSDFVQIADNWDPTKGVQKDLIVQESVNLSDSWATQKVLPILLEVADQVLVADDLDFFRSTVYNLLVQENVEILDDSYLDGTTGYGMGGYGEGGYGGALDFQYVTFELDQVTHAGDDVIHYPS